MAAKALQSRLSGLSDREAARIVGVTHAAIGKARKHGRFRLFADGSIDPASIADWQRNRRAARGGRRQADTAKVATSPDTGCTARSILGRLAYDAIGNVAIMAGSTGDVVAEVLLRAGLPPDRVRSLAQEAAEAMMASAAAFADDLGPPPPDAESWVGHPAMRSTWPAPSDEWAELVTRHGGEP